LGRGWYLRKGGEDVFGHVSVISDCIPPRGQSAPSSIGKNRRIAQGDNVTALRSLPDSIEPGGKVKGTKGGRHPRMRTLNWEEGDAGRLRQTSGMKKGPFQIAVTDGAFQGKTDKNTVWGEIKTPENDFERRHGWSMKRKQH